LIISDPDASFNGCTLRFEGDEQNATIPSKHLEHWNWNWKTGGEYSSPPEVNALLIEREQTFNFADLSSSKSEDSLASQR